MGRRAFPVAGFAALLASLALAGSGPAGDGTRRPGSTFGLEQARAFDEFPLYSAGGLVDGLPLVAVLRRDDAASFVSFVYGDCVPSTDSGCASAAEIQVWPACRRHLALYEAAPEAGPTPERVTVRGVPAAFFDGGTRLEIQTGSSTVVVFADSRERALRLASALRPVGEPSPSLPGLSLPAPLPGAVEGRLAC